MKHRWGRVSGFVILLALATEMPGAAAPGSFVTSLQITGGLSSPLGVTHVGDGTNRLFIVEQCGRIRIWNGSALLAAPFLNIGATGTDLIVCGSERGLLGLAFHPDYETNGVFYVNYTRKSDGDLVVARYEVSADPNVADAGSGTVVLTVEHSHNAFHNGGQIAFGPDGYLYMSIGDAGSGIDAQSINALQGKVLRIDVDGGVPYAIPPDNPFAGATPGADEVWAYGFRNPWRFSFDRVTGDLYIGDVGQTSWEEIDFQAAGSPGGRNYGWDCREGGHVYPGATASCGSLSAFDPILEYDHSLGCSVTGGFVFRNLPAHSFYGNYVFGDLCSGRLWRGIPNGSGGWTSQQLPVTVLPGDGLTSFGESETGRIYLTSLGSGTLWWLAPYTFADVTPTYFAWRFVEAVFANGVIGGCGGDNFCPESLVSRGEMARFLLLAKEGAAYVPPPCTTPLFADVPCSNPLAPWINELVRRGVTAGCGGGNYCPTASVTRSQMAVFLLSTLEGAGFSPPACPPSPFNDVPAGSPFCPWIKEIANRGITAGCGSGSFCTEALVTRGQMSVFLSTNFSLPAP